MKLNRKYNFRKKSDLSLLLLFPLLLCCCFIFTASSQNRNSPSQNNTANVQPQESNTSNSIVSYSVPPKKLYKVTNVIDGDTIEIEEVGRVRLIGIDTPELSNPKECYSSESAQKLRELLENKSVEIEYDPTQGNLDKYDRDLLFVFNEHGQNINLEMIKLGYAFEYTYSKPYKYQSEFKLAEKSAQTSKLGLWNQNTCNGTRIIPETPTPKVEVPNINPTPIAPPLQQEQYSCDCSKTCAKMSCAEAQFQLNTCGCKARDGDGDGIACDSQCQ